MPRWNKIPFQEKLSRRFELSVARENERDEADVFVKELCDSLRIRRESPRYDGDRIGLEIWYDHSVATGNYGGNEGRLYANIQRCPTCEEFYNLHRECEPKCKCWCCAAARKVEKKRKSEELLRI